MRVGSSLALAIATLIVGQDVAAQQYPEVTIPETHQRFLRSAVLDGKEYQISVGLPYG